MIVPCQLALQRCLPCLDDPILNISAEAPDINVFIGFRDFRGNPPLGIIYAQLACKSICFSSTSQRDADDCALRQAQLCVTDTWHPVVNPPIPPGPNGPNGWDTPGGIPPDHPRNPFHMFPNTLQVCEIDCPDGQPFSETVSAGTLLAPSQAMADAMAESLACKRVLEDRICFISTALTAICLGQDYSFQLQAEGGTPFTNQSYEWEIVAGDFPPGLDLNFRTGLISGIPFVSGSYTFTVRVTDAAGHHQAKPFTICIMEIVTGATLPPATEGQAYAQPLIEEPGTVSSEKWTLVSGTLPDGITLASNGALNGTPTETGSFSFSIKVEASCSGTASCTKNFSLEVESGVDCMGDPDAFQDAIWSQISPPASGTITMVGANGNYTGNNAFGPFVEAKCAICNPNMAAYTVSVKFDWTVAGFAFGPTTQVIVRLNGVDHLGVVHAGNGAYSETIMLSLPSGVNASFNVYCTYNGAVGAPLLNGTIAITPTTAP